MSENNTIQIIKKGIALRAKYRVEQGDTPTIKVFAPPLVVPHGKNRGGDPVKSLRTRQLSGTIACDGCVLSKGVATRWRCWSQKVVVVARLQQNLHGCGASKVILRNRSKQTQTWREKSMGSLRCSGVCPTAISIAQCVTCWLGREDANAQKVRWSVNAETAP